MALMDWLVGSFFCSLDGSLVAGLVDWLIRSVDLSILIDRVVDWLGGLILGLVGRLWVQVDHCWLVD